MLPPAAWLDSSIGVGVDGKPVSFTDEHETANSAMTETWASTVTNRRIELPSRTRAASRRAPFPSNR
jgi:hypothetical protein